MTTNIRKESLKNKAYLKIRADIISCQLEPGKLLSEQEVAENLSMIRTPVREALHLLQRDNLVKMVPQRGGFVTEVTVKMMNEVYALREILEPEIVRLATSIIPSEILLNLKQQSELAITEAIPSGKRAELDCIFHSIIAEYCGNDVIVQIMIHLCAQMDRIRTLSCKNHQRSQKAVSEHLAIILAMLGRDAAKTAEAMKIHIKSSCHVAL